MLPVQGMSHQEVFVTGAGMVSPTGPTLRSSWTNILHLTSTNLYNEEPCLSSLERPLDSFTSPQQCHCERAAIAAAGGGDLCSGLEGVDHITRFAVAAAEEAVAHAGLSPADFVALDPGRSRVSIGTSKGGVITFGRAFDSLEGARRGGLAPDADQCRDMLRDILPDGAACCVARRFGITGGAYATVAACATGVLAIIQAARWIQAGEADIVLAGSSDASLTPLWLGAFQRMGVLAKPHPTLGPRYACRPFDRTREGFTLGEGAAVLVLESSRSVARRGVQPIARIAGFAAGSDPAGLTGITPDAESLATVLKLALRRGGSMPGDLVAVMAHGTATQANDAAEARALRLALGDQASRVPIVSVKGRMGHLLGAAGSVETALSALAVFHQRLPGNATLLEPDPALGTLNLPRSTIELPKGPILKVSMGFGGHLGAILLAPRLNSKPASCRRRAGLQP